MPSKFKAKQAKPVTKQMSPLKEILLRVDALDRRRAYCTNCGMPASTDANRYSKCYCGGTFQRIKLTNERAL